MSQDERNYLRSLSKAMLVVQLLAEAGGLGITEISSRLGLSKTAAHRIVSTLRVLGMVTQEEHSRRYHLSPQLWEHAVRALHRSPLFDLGLKHTQLVARQIGHHTNFSIPDGPETLFLASVKIEDEMPLLFPVAVRRPAYCNAAGKAMLAFMPVEEVEQVVRRGLHRVTDATITEPEHLLAELAEIRSAGLAFNRGELHEELFGMAVPIFDADRSPVAAIGMSARRELFTDAFVRETTRAMLGSSREVSHALGFRDSSPDATSLI